MTVLKRGRMVQIVKDHSGGYQLALTPNQITIGSVFRLMVGPLAPLGNRMELEGKIKSSGRQYALFETLT